MKRKSLFILPALALLATGVSAQLVQPAQKNSAKDNWFISFGAGTNLLMGEQDRDIDFGKRIDVSGEVSVGKWFSPFVGARFQFTGGQAKGFNHLNDRGGYYTRPDRSVSVLPKTFPPTDLYENGFYQKIAYTTMGVDMMANFTTLFRGDLPNRKIDVIPFVGAGLSQTIDGDQNPASGDVYYKAGLRTCFNFTKVTSLYAEVQGYVLNREFDGYVGHAQNDGLATFMIGMQFNINPTRTEPIDLSTQFDDINNRINEQRAIIDSQNNLLEKQNNQLKDQQARIDSIKANCCNAKVVTVEKLTEITNVTYETEYIYFGMNSSYFSKTEAKKVDGAITYLKNNPQSKMLVMGYADRATGTPAYNKAISEKRVNRVVEYMGKKGIRKDRLIIQSYGDENQPEMKNENNRVVILMER